MRAEAPAQSATTFALAKPLTLLGAVGGVVATLVPWIDVFGDSANAFDVPIQFLAYHRTSAGTTVAVGLLVVMLAAVAAATSLVPALGRLHVGRIMGAGLLMVAGVFLLQLSRVSGDLGVDLTDVSGAGPFVAAVAGILLLVGR